MYIYYFIKFLKEAVTAYERQLVSHYFLIISFNFYQ